MNELVYVSLDRYRKNENHLIDERHMTGTINLDFLPEVDFSRESCCAFLTQIMETNTSFQDFSIHYFFVIYRCMKLDRLKMMQFSSYLLGYLIYSIKYSSNLAELKTRGHKTYTNTSNEKK